jgi:hypothetical protein
VRPEPEQSVHVSQGLVRFPCSAWLVMCHADLPRLIFTSNLACLVCHVLDGEIENWISFDTLIDTFDTWDKMSLKTWKLENYKTGTPRRPTIVLSGSEQNGWHHHDRSASAFKRFVWNLEQGGGE